MSESGGKRREHDDAAQALRFLLIKAAIFIGIPIVASVVAVLVMLK